MKLASQSPSGVLTSTSVKVSGRSFGAALAPMPSASDATTISRREGSRGRAITASVVNRPQALARGRRTRNQPDDQSGNRPLHEVRYRLFDGQLQSDVEVY